MGTQIKAIFLDIGGVVLRIDWSFALAHLELPDQDFGDRLRREIDGSAILHQFERGKVSEGEFLAGIQKDFLPRHDLVTIKSAWNSIVREPLPKIDAIFDTYSGKVPIYALSNTNTIHFEHMMAHYPVLNRFDQIFTSFDLGARKPDALIFERAAELAGISPAEGIFFDDLPANIQGAEGVGFQGYVSVNSPETTLTILRSKFAPV